MKNRKTLYLTQAAMIAALYVVLTHIANMLGLASGAVQIRFSEALTILPFFTPAAIPGLFLGCLLSNLTTGCILWDTIFGSIATLAGAVGTCAICRVLTRENTQKSRIHALFGKMLLTLPPVIANTIVVPLVLRFAYGVPTPLWLSALTVCAGELISCTVLGLLLFALLTKRKNSFL